MNSYLDIQFQNLDMLHYLHSGTKDVEIQSYQFHLSLIFLDTSHQLKICQSFAILNAEPTHSSRRQHPMPLDSILAFELVWIVFLCTLRKRRQTVQWDCPPISNFLIRCQTCNRLGRKHVRRMIQLAKGSIGWTGLFRLRGIRLSSRCPTKKTQRPMFLL